MTSLKIVIATGIYPPAIGGPATYARELAERLQVGGAVVNILTYGAQSSDNNITFVSQSGGPLLRWWRFAQALKRQAADADIIYVLSSVSCGVPLWLSKFTKPKRVLRLGGDFFWERYTDRGGRKDLRTWYASPSVWRRVMKWLLQQFDAIIFSTQFQYDIYREHYSLPEAVVIENALPRAEGHLNHVAHSPLRLLVMSRLVRFKNVSD